MDPRAPQSPSPTPAPPRSGGEEAPASFKGGTGLKRVVSALRYSRLGLHAAWKYEAAFRQEVVIGVPLVVFAAVAAPGRWQALALIGSIMLAWVVELLNSAVEAIADAVTLKPHPLLGRAKDLGSAAVMVSLVFAAVVWAVVWWPAAG